MSAALDSHCYIEHAAARQLDAKHITRLLLAAHLQDAVAAGQQLADLLANIPHLTVPLRQESCAAV